MSVPNSTRSGQRSMNARVVYGCRPSSPIRAAMSTWKFGARSRIVATRAEVLGRAPDVGADEHRRRVADDDGLEPVDQLVERREAVEIRAAGRAGRPEVPVGVLVELLPALVPCVERLEERDRVGDVDRHRDAELARGGPQRVQARVVDRDERARRRRAPAARAASTP